MLMKGKLFVLSGPSGVGKGTIRELLMQDASLNLHFSISMTTRKPRLGEIDGVHYFFVSQEEFLKAINEDKLLEYAQFVNNYYGTPQDYVDKLLNEGKNVLLEIEVQGAMQVMAKRKDAVTIFIMPPSFEELERRIRGRRTEPEEIVQQRLAKANYEMKLQDNYKHVVVNDTVENASLQISKIMKDEIRN